jgi:hypothetical protein
VLVVDTANGRVAIGADTAAYPLDVTGDINSSTGLRVGGNLVCDSTGCASSGSSGFYIQNGVAKQTTANFNIETADVNSVVGVLQGLSGQGLVIDWRTVRSGDTIQTSADFFDTARLFVALVGTDAALDAVDEYGIEPAPTVRVQTAGDVARSSAEGLP